MLDRCRQALVAVHGHEILIGLPVHPGAPRLAGVSVASRILAEERSEGLADEDIVFRQPVVLALVPPHVQGVPALPPSMDTQMGPIGDDDGGDGSAVLREPLRLGARWLQELAGRAAWVLRERLAGSGRLVDPGAVRHPHLEELGALVATASRSR
jgi:rifampicin phosphotransferase